MGTRVLLTIAAATASLALAACGGDDDATTEGESSAGGSESAPALDIAAIEKQLGSATQSKSTSCTEPESAEEGATFDCTIDSDAGEVTLAMTQDDADATEFSYKGEASGGGVTQSFEGTLIVK